MSYFFFRNRNFSPNAGIKTFHGWQDQRCREIAKREGRLGPAAVNNHQNVRK